MEGTNRLTFLILSVENAVLEKHLQKGSKRNLKTIIVDSFSEKMKLLYDKDTDSLYMDLKSLVSTDSKEVADGVVVDFDASGNIMYHF